MALTADKIRETLMLHSGRQRAIKAPDLAWQILARSPNPSDTRTVRRLVKVLRLKGEPICSHSQYGYWWAASPEELEAACQFLRGKAMSSLKQISHLRRFVKPTLAGQLPLLDAPTDDPEPQVMELPGNLLALLDQFCAERELNRDAAVRQAVATYLVERGCQSAQRFAEVPNASH